MLILGDKEIEQNMVAVRSRREGDIGKMTLDEFISKLKKEIEEKQY
ncbi:MAG: Threonine--tRNA ligase [Firmicutes bacterium ADurb.Bin356]|nr:MAG: Threonine--tRNA ligase [Firmicutes bacterium ADurb.Bin356]